MKPVRAPKSSTRQCGERPLQVCQVVERSGFEKHQTRQVRGSRVSPIGVVQERKHTINKRFRDTNFEHRDGQGGRPIREQIKACALAGVMRHVLQRMVGVQAELGGRARFIVMLRGLQNRSDEDYIIPRRYSGLWVRAEAANLSAVLRVKVW